MSRILLLCGLCLLLPGFAHGSNQLESIALAEMAPVLIGLLAFTLAILLGAPFLLRAELRAPRQLPGRLYSASVLLASLLGVFISGLSYQLDGRHNSYFPNLLTEVYVPVALLVGCLKQLRRRNVGIVRWLSGAAAGVLLLTTAVAGLASLGEARYFYGRHAHWAELVLLPVVWLVFCWRLRQWLVDAPAQSRGYAWLVPILGPTLAALYRILLLAARAWLFNLTDSFSVRGQVLPLLLQGAIGLLAMAAVFWLPGIRLPVRPPTPSDRPRPQG